MPHPSRPLIVTSDPAMLDELLRLAAASGVEVEVAADLVAARASWAGAPLVVLGPDIRTLTGGMSAIGPPAPTRIRRPEVVLVGADLDDAGIWQRAVELGAANVVFLPDAEQWLVERFADAGEEGRATSLTICVLGGRGGAGASTLSAALALTGMRRGRRAMLVDGDPLGGGLDLILGREDTGGLRWPDLTEARGRLSSRALYDALPRMDDLLVLSWDRGDTLTIAPTAMESVLGAARRTSDLVVVDLPRRLDPSAEVALRACDLALIVVPAEVRATAAASRVAAAAGLAAADLRVVVRGPAPSKLPAHVVAQALGLPLAGSMRAEPGLAAALERGDPPARRGRGPLADFCSSFLDSYEAAARQVAA